MYRPGLLSGHEKVAVTLRAGVSPREGDRGRLSRMANSRWRRLATPAGLAALCLLGAGLVLARQIELGVGLGFDSAHYVHLAGQLLAGEPLLRLDGMAFTNWPPFFSVMLAAASVGVFDPLDVAGPLNATLFGVMVLLCGTFLHRRLAATPLLAWCGCAAIAVSPTLVDHAATALPTQLFSLLIAGALICVAERDPGWRRLLLAAACAALACLTRYSGVALLAVVCAMLLGSSELRWPKRVMRAATFAIIAFAPLGLWLLAKPAS